jgi:hypothetical protein
MDESKVGAPVWRTDRYERSRGRSSSHFGVPLPRGGSHAGAVHRRHSLLSSRGGMEGGKSVYVLIPKRVRKLISPSS